MTGDSGERGLFASVAGGGRFDFILISAVCLGLWGVLSLAVLLGIALPLSMFVTEQRDTVALQTSVHRTRPQAEAALRLDNSDEEAGAGSDERTGEVFARTAQEVLVPGASVLDGRLGPESIVEPGAETVRSADADYDLARLAR